MQKFYVVATPIGNLEDITYRAVKILSEVDLILCEDTRVTINLLNKYDIKKPTMSYHSQSKLSKLDKILEMISEGKTLALVSDAGTPTISDPGSVLVSKIRESFPAVEIIAVPGASALVSALSISGLPASEFVFLGFLPHKKGRETLFNEISGMQRTVAFYESPHRLIKSLKDILEIFGNRKICVAREITKIHEEFFRGTVAEAACRFEQEVLGEITLLIEGKPAL